MPGVRSNIGFANASTGYIRDNIMDGGSLHALQVPVCFFALFRFKFPACIAVCSFALSRFLTATRVLSHILVTAMQPQTPRVFWAYIGAAAGSKWGLLDPI